MIIPGTGLRVGDLRPSQLMFTFGVGSIIDLPHLSVIVSGLDFWPTDPTHTQEIQEDRLLRAVRWQLGPQVQRLLAPPVVPESVSLPGPFSHVSQVGVPVSPFPRWLYCPKCSLLAPLETGLFELKPDPFHPDRTCYLHTNCSRANKPPVVAARFLVACENGHLDDFPWFEFVHRGPSTCKSSLRLIERGPSGEARDLEVRCSSCEKARRLSEAFGAAGKESMPLCRGRRPHLHDYDEHECNCQVKAILLGASNLWFADVLSTLALPTESDRLAQLVESHWAVLKHIQAPSIVTYARITGQLGDFAAFTDDEVWQAIERKHQKDLSGEQEGLTDLKQPEWEIFTNPTSKPSTDDFRLRQVDIPRGYEDRFASVVLVERMREVRALLGFTRIDAPGELDESLDVPTPNRMTLSRSDPTWLPANEVRGEGIFIQVKESAIHEWLERPAVKAQNDQFFDSHQRWRKARRLEPPEANYPGMRYILLHSFSHALMRQLTLECGYTAASIRERVFSRNSNEAVGGLSAMAGVLVYTGAPDSEGTLGGLVSLGQPDELSRLLGAALRDAQRCASDPLCAEHLPSQMGITVHGAACHACMFAPETSCERGNKYLDRSVLVPTVAQEMGQSDLAFFQVAQ